MTITTITLQELLAFLPIAKPIHEPSRMYKQWPPTEVAPLYEGEYNVHLVPKVKAADESSWIQQTQQQQENSEKAPWSRSLGKVWIVVRLLSFTGYTQYRINEREYECGDSHYNKKPAVHHPFFSSVDGCLYTHPDPYTCVC